MKFKLVENLKSTVDDIINTLTAHGFTNIQYKKNSNFIVAYSVKINNYICIHIKVTDSYIRKNHEFKRNKSDSVNVGGITYDGQITTYYNNKGYSDIHANEDELRFIYDEELFDIYILNRSNLNLINIIHYY